MNNCPEWRDANGKAKANLFLVVVSLNPKAKNTFFGGAYSSAISTDDANSIFSQAANPYFRSGQFGEGIGAALKDFGAKVAAFHDQAKHPVQQTTTINEQATDMSGFWKVLGWLLAILTFGGIGLFIVFAVRSRKQQKERTIAAQQTAVAIQQKAATAFRNADSSLPGYTDIATRYRDLSNSVTYDPNTEGLSEEGYNTIASQWNDLYFDIRNLRAPKTETPKASYSVSRDEVPVSRPKAKKHAASTSTHTHTEPTRTEHTTVVNNSNDLLTGMVIGSVLSDNHEAERRAEERRAEERREEERRETRRREEEESSRSSYSSGSDSSWGSSSSSDSSSSWSSGSDSSWGGGFDSGGSFGGGGSDSSW